MQGTVALLGIYKFPKMEDPIQVLGDGDLPKRNSIFMKNNAWYTKGKKEGNDIFLCFPAVMRRIHPPQHSHCFHFGHFSLMQGTRTGLKSGFR
jgi:hypothetical protein